MNHLQRMKQFKDIFGFPVPVDNSIMIIRAPGNKQPSLNFHNLLFNLKINGYNEQESVKSFIIKKYGSQGHELIKTFI